jgi:sphingolipid delta-4 desaturase
MTIRPTLDFIYSEAPTPHWGRRRAILAQHPGVKTLMVPNPYSALWIAALVCAQGAVASLLRDAHWLLVLVLAYLVGAFVSHALYVQIHECTHNLATKRPTVDKILGLVCDLALFFPSAMAFRKYHLLHHKHLGHRELDPDIVSRPEADLIGNSPWRKAVWIFFLSISQALRPYKVRSVGLWDGWIAANLVVVVLADAAILYGFGVKALAYLAFSTLFALGLHPLGGRWVQEHYVTTEGQETYSYYGILNKLCFNMGFHNEHHDFPNIPWNNLPKLTKMAPEYYRDLKSYRSWTAVLLNFIFNSKMSAYSRIVRADSK